MHHSFCLLLLLIILASCTYRTGQIQSASNAARTTPAVMSRTQGKVDSELSPQDTISADYFPNGKIKQLILSKDSGDCQELHLAYYQNGQLKSKGCQGQVQNADVSTGMSVGTWYYYDSLTNHVDSTLFFDNEVADKAFIEKRSFYGSGPLKSIEIYNNYILYETEIRPKGTWKYFSENGKLLKTIRH